MPGTHGGSRYYPVSYTHLDVYKRQAIISHCYHKLAKCLTVGYPFYLQQWKAEDYKQMFIDMILRVTKSLECRDIEGLIEQWGTFLEEQVQYSRTFVEQTKG